MKQIPGFRRRGHADVALPPPYGVRTSTIPNIGGRRRLKRSRKLLFSLLAILLLACSAYIIVELYSLIRLSHEERKGTIYRTPEPPRISPEDQEYMYDDWRDEEEYPYDGDEEPLPEPEIVVGGQSAVPSREKKLRFPFTRAQCSRALKGREKELIVQMLQHSWRAYRRYAWGMDELQPLSRTYNNLGHGTAGVGYMIVDTIDTLLLAGLNAEAEEALLWVERELTFDHAFSVSVFETNIRVLGGLLAAYELTGREFLKNKAVDLGDRLLKAFGVRRDGLPINTVVLNGPKLVDKKPPVFLSEFGSLQLEFFTLSRITGDWKYDRAARRVYDIIAPHCRRGICPEKIPGDVMLPQNDFDGSQDWAYLGARGDSYYEYLAKYYILAGKRPEDEMLIRQWRKTMNALVEQTSFGSSADTEDRSEKVPQADRSNLNTDVSEHMTRSHFTVPFDMNHRSRPMEQLACFSGGLFALTAMQLSSDEGGAEAEPDLLQAQHAATPQGNAVGATQKLRTWKSSKERNLFIGEEIGATCHHMYRTSPSGLAPETALVQRDGGLSHVVHNYFMRPETVETYFYLWRATKNEMYREWGREMLEAWCLQLAHPNGFVGLENVSIARRPRWMSKEDVQLNRERREKRRAGVAVPPVDEAYYRKNPDTDVAHDRMETFWTAESLKYMFLLFSDDDVMNLDEWVFNTEGHAFRIVERTAKS